MLIFRLIAYIIRGLRHIDKCNEPMTEAEVDQLLTELASKQSEDLNWRLSAVDLMKLLNLDSSLKARKQLAKELGYEGEVEGGSAEMNIWLAQEIRKRVAEHHIDNLRT